MFECARGLHEALLVPFLMYSSETIFWKKERSIRSVKMDNLRDIRKMDRVPNAQIRELCGVMKGVIRSEEGSI